MWPSCGTGSILITCRSELTAASSATTSIEVPAFTNEEGGELLIQELGLTECSQVENTLSIQFSETLGGHALTLDVMARHMRARQKTLEEFVEIYQKNPRSLHKRPRRRIANKYYDKDDDPESLWSIAFSQLEPLTAEVFGILCMLAPNRVPSSIFLKKHSIPSLEEIDSTE